MKKWILSLLIAVCSYSIFAQSLIEPIADMHTSRRFEVGAFSQNHFQSDSKEQQLSLGLQFKKWIKPNLGLRLLAGYQRYSNTMKPTVLNAIDNHTMNVSYRSAKANLVFVGAGVELQRHFYKRVYLFAAADIYGGYGNGDYESQYAEVKIDNSNWQDLPPIPFGQGMINSYNRGYVKIVPSIGGKFMFSRLNFGSEISFAECELVSSKVASQNRVTLTESDLFSTISYRMFFNYRF